MGGKALLPQVPGLKSLRKFEYDIYVREVQQILNRALGTYSNQLKVIPSYVSKPDFGDIDIIVNGGILNDNWAEVVKKSLNSKATFHTPNSNVTSFEYEDCSNRYYS